MSRCASVNVPIVTINPPFELRANAATAGSISPASRTTSGLNSTPNDGAHALDCGQLADPDRSEGIAKNCHPAQAGHGFFQQFEPFGAEAVFEAGKPGGVPARPCQACNQAGPDRID